MGEEDINVHDQWAVESMGAIQDRTREHLGTSDKVIMANRRAAQGD
jgi:phthalate 4,5-dioxygenase oxygenase subunit